MDDLPAAVHGGRLDEVEILGGILMLEDFNGDEIGGWEGADGCEEINFLRRGFEHLVRLFVDEGKIRETEETRMADHDLRAFQEGFVMLFEGWRVEVVDETLSGLVAFRSDVDGQIESESGLSHSIIALIPPVTVTTGSECFVLWMRVMRLLKPCNHHCDFHEYFVKNIA